MTLRIILILFTISSCFLSHGKAQDWTWGGAHEKRNVFSIGTFDDQYLYLDIRSIADGAGAPVRMVIVRSDSSKEESSFKISKKLKPTIPIKGFIQLLYMGKGLPGLKELRINNQQIHATFRKHIPMTLSDTSYQMKWKWSNQAFRIDTCNFMFGNERPWDGVQPYPIVDTLSVGRLSFHDHNDPIIFNDSLISGNPFSMLAAKWIHEKGSSIDYFSSFYPGNIVKVSGNERGGKRVGSWESWYSTGESREKLKYIAGSPTGDYVMHSRLGNILVSGKYWENAKTGIWQSKETCQKDLSRTCLFTFDYSFSSSGKSKLRKVTDDQGKVLVREGKGKVYVLSYSNGNAIWQKKVYKKGRCVRTKSLQIQPAPPPEREFFLY